MVRRPHRRILLGGVEVHHGLQTFHRLYWTGDHLEEEDVAFLGRHRLLYRCREILAVELGRSGHRESEIDSASPRPNTPTYLVLAV